MKQIKGFLSLVIFALCGILYGADIFLDDTTDFATLSPAPSVGTTITTLGYHTKNDNGGATYKVASYDEDKIGAGIQIDINGTYAAELVNPSDIQIEQIGVINSSTQDATTRLQPYIDYFRDSGDAVRIRLRLATYYLHTQLKILNLGNNTSLTIQGVSKSRINSQGTGSIFYANTGGIGILIAGSENVNFENFSVVNDPGSGTLTTPSTIGIMLARTNTKRYCQFINFSKLHVRITSNNTSINNYHGGIGIYNYASESHEWKDVSIYANTPMVMTTSNIDNISYTDSFNNSGTETVYTTTNFNYTNLQLYPVTNSAIIIDTVRDLKISTLLAYGVSPLNKYLIEFYSDAGLVNRRIFVDNIHTEYIRRGFRVATGLFESTFKGKLGANITSAEIFRIVDDGFLNNVECNCFIFGSGTVTVINDDTSNESFNVRMMHSEKTNSTPVAWEYDLGSAIYKDFHVHADTDINTINANITASASCIMYLHGTDGTYPRGSYFRGTTATRPTTGLYPGKRYFDTTLGYSVEYNGSTWVK